MEEQDVTEEVAWTFSDLFITKHKYMLFPMHSVQLGNEETESRKKKTKKKVDGDTRQEALSR